MNGPSLLQVPPGVPCRLGEEARRRRAIEAAVAAVFAGWSYEEVLLPLVDFEEVFLEGGGLVDATRLYRFVGRDGRGLALRADATALVAKVVASRLADRPRPLRLFYRGEVLRAEPPRAGGAADSYHIGLEHVGTRGRGAELEILVVAFEALDGLGVRDAVASVGHAGFLFGLLDQAGVDAARRRRLLPLMRSRDVVGLGEALGGRVPAELATAFDAVGGRDVLVEARRWARGPRARAALGELEALADELETLGLAGRVRFDLGEVRRLDYYTGMVFEIDAPGARRELGGGGRYDRLLERFGAPEPAVGFSLSVDRLADWLAAHGRAATPAPAPLACGRPGEPPSRALARARAARRRGETVVVAMGSQEEGP